MRSSRMAQKLVKGRVFSFFESALNVFGYVSYVFNFKTPKKFCGKIGSKHMYRGLSWIPMMVHGVSWNLQEMAAVPVVSILGCSPTWSETGFEKWPNQMRKNQNHEKDRPPHPLPRKRQRKSSSELEKWGALIGWKTSREWFIERFPPIKIC